MLRCIGAATALALAASGPAYAGDKGQGHGHGTGQASVHAGHDKGHKADKGGPAGKGDRFDAAAKARDTRDGFARRGFEPARGVDRDRDDSRDRARAHARSDERDDRWTEEGDRRFALLGACPPGLAKKDNGCLPPGQAKKRVDEWGYEVRPALFGIPVRTRAEYAYYDGYLIPTTGNTAYIPLLGGALAVGQLWPERYPVAPIADWQSRYFGFDDPRYYRNTDNVIYRVDPETAAIQSVVALLTGSDFVVGAPMPAGYDVYNVPGAYQARYYDDADALYRYADGRIYEVDPTTMLVTGAIDLVT